MLGVRAQGGRRDKLMARIGGRGRSGVQWLGGLLVDGDVGTEKGFHLALVSSILVLHRLFHLIELLLQDSKGIGKRIGGIK